jgi:hypothetical protein
MGSRTVVESETRDHGRVRHEVETVMTEIRNPIVRKHYGKY